MPKTRNPERLPNNHHVYRLHAGGVYYNIPNCLVDRVVVSASYFATLETVGIRPRT